MPACRDLVELENLDDAGVLDALKQRLQGAEPNPYTRIGPRSVLISCNPYRKLDLYADEIIDLFYGSDIDSSEREPHIYAIASDAYKALRTEGVSQPVLTSGESGSGKT